MRNWLTLVQYLCILNMSVVECLSSTFGDCQLGATKRVQVLLRSPTEGIVPSCHFDSDCALLVSSSCDNTIIQHLKFPLLRSMDAPGVLRPPGVKGSCLVESSDDRDTA
ncbi:uncharacterized protein F5147DRAFT_720383 [Suillus discolor]|uniref:Uncharacterized protein n=1 Tax=Suillus discolor TaxID=1912936 RepID=A0A9P7EVP6_9AGAM|nr:uncharacterized protein F5147DRAFT_720383 [Suillus discolor]KAG2093894.1 hypothetical protein F5147DRAFT_720383 [Suillus discolor]